jgi:hypothetical protein
MKVRRELIFTGCFYFGRLKFNGFQTFEFVSGHILNLKSSLIQQFLNLNQRFFFRLWKHEHDEDNCQQAETSKRKECVLHADMVRNGREENGDGE